MLDGKLVVVPGGGRVGWQRSLVRQFDARVVGGSIGTEIESQNLRQQDDAVQIDGTVRFELVDHHRRARRTVAFAKQILGRIPALVLGQELSNEFAEGVSIRVKTKESLLLVVAGDATESGARRIDEHHVRRIEQTVGVVDQ